MRFMLDENVPVSVADVLEAHGHEVEFIRDYAPQGSADPIVATVSEELEAVLITFDGDFQKIAPRIPFGQRRRFRLLSRIWMRCSEPNAAARLESVLSFVTDEYDIAQTRADVRMHLTIAAHFLRTER